MSTPSASGLRPALAPRIAWIPIVAVFVIGAAIGGFAASAVTAPTQGQQIVTGPPASTTELSRLVRNMDAAAQRGETRLFVEFREELAGLIRAAGIAEYEWLRGIDISDH